MFSNTTLEVFGRYTSGLCSVCLLLSIVLCLVYRKEAAIPLKRLSYFLIWNLLIELLAYIMYWGYNNLPLLHLYTLGEFLLLSYFFKSLINKPAYFQKAYKYFVMGASVLIVLNSVFLQSIYEFNNNAKTFVQLVIIAYAVLYFYNLVENQNFSAELAKSLRLINSAIIVYYSGSLFIFMCSQISFKNTDTYQVFWAFNTVLNLVFQLLILLGLWKVFFRKKALEA